MAAEIALFGYERSCGMVYICIF